MPDCVREDAALAKWTFLRYGVLGLIMLSRVIKLLAGALKAEQTKKAASEPLLGGAGYKKHPYNENPKLTRRIQDRWRASWSGKLESVAVAGGLFVLTEGIGLAIYFSISAVMDNVAIFLFSGHGFCKTVKAVSLYTVAVVTFLPNVLLGSALQKKWYNAGDMKWKAMFLALMTCITIASFILRMWLVYNQGYASLVDSWLRHVGSSCKVALAVAIPPVVDGIQSTMLIMVGRNAKPLLKDIIDERLEKNFRAIEERLKKLEEIQMEIVRQCNVDISNQVSDKSVRDCEEHHEHGTNCAVL